MALRGTAAVLISAEKSKPWNMCVYHLLHYVIQLLVQLQYRIKLSFLRIYRCVNSGVNFWGFTCLLEYQISWFIRFSLLRAPLLHSLTNERAFRSVLDINNFKIAVGKRMYQWHTFYCYLLPHWFPLTMFSFNRNQMTSFKMECSAYHILNICHTHEYFRLKWIWQLFIANKQTCKIKGICLKMKTKC